MEHLFLMFLDHTQRRSCVYVCGVCVCCVWCVWCVWCVYVFAWCSLLSKTLSLNHSMTKFHSVRNTTHTHTAQFYNERISTDPILITWQNTVYEPPEDGFKKRPKHVGASVKCFNPLRTVRPIYRTGVPLPSKCCILYKFFNNYKY